MGDSQERDRCPICDRPRAVRYRTPEPIDAKPVPTLSNVCLLYGDDDCHFNAVDWRARYLEAVQERDHVVAVSQRIARHSRERIEIHRKWLRRVIGEWDAAKRRAKAWKLAAKRQRQRAGAAIVAWRDALSRVRDEAGRGRGG